MTTTLAFPERPRMLERLREARDAYMAVATDETERPNIRSNAASVAASFQISILRIEGLGDEPVPPFEGRRRR